MKKDFPEMILSISEESCEPKLTIQKMKTEHNEMNLNIKLIANEIAFIRIRKIFRGNKSENS